jgi:hypothetical protein
MKIGVRLGGRRVRIAAIAVAALLVVPVAALALTPRDGGWIGQTSQGKSITFQVRSNGTKVRSVRFGWRANCGGASITATTTLSGPANINSSDRFVLSSGGTVVKGTFTAKRRANGTLRASQTIYGPFGPTQCTTGLLSWRAHHR